MFSSRNALIKIFHSLKVVDYYWFSFRIVGRNYRFDGGCWFLL